MGDFKFFSHFIQVSFYEQNLYLFKNFVKISTFQYGQRDRTVELWN